MKKEKLFSGLSKSELIDAAIYFPILTESCDVKAMLNDEDLDRLKINSLKFNAIKTSKEKAISIINKYFETNKYGDLIELSKLQWVVQLIRRKQILALLRESNISKRYKKQLQNMIFEMIQNPIINDVYINKLSTKNINHLTVEQLHSLSKEFQSNGAFNLIQESFLIGPEQDGSITDETKSLLNNLSELENTIITLDRSHKVIATIDLSINDKQLENEFKEFLKLKRKELKIESSVSKFKEGDIISLIKHNVLQYLDLQILTCYMAKSKTLKHSENIAYLFPPEHPDHDIALDKFRDSTIKHSKRAITQNFIDILLSSINKKENISFSKI